MVDKTPEENDVPKDEKFDKEGNLFIKLTIDDSALVVRADGGIEMISHELEKAEGGYVGDIEDLNKTFSLVLALTSALENEDLYNRIYHNLNLVLMQKWEEIPEDIKADIIHKRRNTAINRNPKEREQKNKRVQEFRNRMNKYKDQFLDEERKKLRDDMQREAEFFQELGDDFVDPMQEMMGQRQPNPKRIKRPKINPLHRMRNVNWNPYDESILKAKQGQWRLDAPPDEEE